MAYLKILGSAPSVSLALNTVVIGPIGLEDPADVSLVSITGGGGSTTPTAPRIQIDLLGNNHWADFPNGSITPATTAGAVILLTANNLVGKFVRVIAAGAFGAGDASLEFYGSMK